MSTPDWIDRALYPFRSRWVETAHGRVHYVDEGEGPAILMVHGTPTWSFLFRGLIADLSRDHRVVAPDHLGFGLSEKPREAPYRPEDHAERLSGVVERLGLRDVTLVVHDFGGPIGLARALERPDEVRALVLFNTWMWSLEGTPAEKASRLFSTPVGRFLYTRLNLSPRVLMKAAFADKAKLSREVHRHYLRPFPRAAERPAPWELARALIGSDAWYEALWSRRDRLAGLPTLLLWGMKDPFFGPDFLARWRQALPRAEVTAFPDAGHFVPEEVEGGVLAEAIRAHVAGSAPSAPDPRRTAGA